VKSNEKNSSEIIKRLDRIEKQHRMGDYDKIFILTFPVVLFILGLLINFGFRDDPALLIVLMGLLFVFPFPLALYLSGIWRGSLTERLNAWFVFLLYSVFYILFVIPLATYLRIFPREPVILIPSFILLAIGAFAACVILVLQGFTIRILPAFEKVDPNLWHLKWQLLNVISCIKRFQIKKLVIISLTCMISSFVVPSLLYLGFG
jgi:hypothetical protein